MVATATLPPMPTRAVQFLLGLLTGRVKTPVVVRVHFLTAAPPPLGRRLEAGDLTEGEWEPLVIEAEEWVLAEGEAVLHYSTQLQLTGDSPVAWALSAAAGNETVVLATGDYPPYFARPADRRLGVEVSGRIVLRFAPGEGGAEA